MISPPDSAHFSASQSLPRITPVQASIISCPEACHSFLKCSPQIHSGPLVPTPNLFANTFESTNLIISTLAPNLVKASHYFKGQDKTHPLANKDLKTCTAHILTIFSATSFKVLARCCIVTLGLLLNLSELHALHKKIGIKIRCAWLKTW